MSNSTGQAGQAGEHRTVPDSAGQHRTALAASHSPRTRLRMVVVVVAFLNGCQASKSLYHAHALCGTVHFTEDGACFTDFATLSMLQHLALLEQDLAWWWRRPSSMVAKPQRACTLPTLHVAIKTSDHCAKTSIKTRFVLR